MRPRFAGGAVDLRPEEIVRLEDDRVVLLDQRRLPEEEVEVECRSAAEVAEAIRSMVVRGAPAIGVAAAYCYALAAARGEDLDQAAAALAGARPTAVNLSWAIAEMRSADGDLAERARDIHRAEVEHCRRMGGHAAGRRGAGSVCLSGARLPRTRVCAAARRDAGLPDQRRAAPDRERARHAPGHGALHQRPSS